MAEQMVQERDAAVIELNDAIRQVERYLISYNPSAQTPRITGRESPVYREKIK